MTNDGKVATVAPPKPEATKAVIQWKGESIPITFHDVKTLICPLATDQEVAIFLKTCQSLQLNPFANECHLIKYDSREKAAFVIAIDAYLKAAEANSEYDGNESGIILKEGSGKLDFREGAFVLDEERARLVGGWAKVYRKDRSRPTYVAVNKTECVKLTREGKPTQFWAEPKQPWMLRKSALKRALVEAFPSLFAGTLATAEVAPDKEYQLEEGQIPAAFQNGDAPDWPQFWVRVQNELLLTEAEAHQLLGVDSLKELLDAGHTLEQVWVMLVEKLKAIRASEPPVAPDDGEDYDDYAPLFDEPAPEKPAVGTTEWLRESLNTLQWADVGKYLREHYGVNGATVRLMIEALTPDQRQEFVDEVQRRVEGEGKG